MNALPGRRMPVVMLASIPIMLGELNGFYNPLLSRSSPTVFWAVDFASFVVIPGLIALRLATSSDMRPKHYGLQFPPRLSHELLGSSLFLGALLFILYFLSQRLLWGF